MKKQHDILSRQKEIAGLLVKSQIFNFILILPVTILTFWCAGSFTADFKIFVSILTLGILLGLVCVFVLVMFFYCLWFRLMFNKVSFIVEDTTEIVCKKFRLLGFLKSPGSRGAIIVYIDINNKKYYGFSRSDVHPMVFRKFIKEKTVGKKLTIKHYAGTNLLTESPITLYDYQG